MKIYFDSLVGEEDKDIADDDDDDDAGPLPCKGQVFGVYNNLTRLTLFFKLALYLSSMILPAPIIQGLNKIAKIKKKKTKKNERNFFYPIQKFGKKYCIFFFWEEMK